MSEIGELVQDAIDLSSESFYTRAFTKTCFALNETVKKYLGKDKVSEQDVKVFIDENWWLVSFIGLQGAFPVENEIVEEARKKVYKTGTNYTMEEVLYFIILQNLRTKGLPFGLEFKNHSNFLFEENKVLIPKNLIFGLLGVSIFHPVNKDEKLDDRYWIEFVGFKMFVSELWGREDLIRRIQSYG